MKRMIDFIKILFYAGVTFAFYHLTFEADNLTQGILFFAVMGGFGLLAIVSLIKLIVSLFKKDEYENKETDFEKF